MKELVFYLKGTLESRTGQLKAESFSEIRTPDPGLEAAELEAIKYQAKVVVAKQLGVGVEKVEIISKEEFEEGRDKEVLAQIETYSEHRVNVPRGTSKERYDEQENER